MRGEIFKLRAVHWNANLIGQDEEEEEEEDVRQMLVAKSFCQGNFKRLENIRAKWKCPSVWYGCFHARVINILWYLMKHEYISPYVFHSKRNAPDFEGIVPFYLR